MLYDSPEEEIADRYFSFANDVIGVLGISLAATALQFENPEPFGAFFFVVLMLWTFTKGSEYRKIAKRYIARYKGFFGSIALMWRLNIYLVGFTSLFSIAMGKLTKTSIYAAWPF